MAFPESEHSPDTAEDEAPRGCDPAGKMSDTAVGAVEEKYGVLSFVPTGDEVYMSPWKRRGNSSNSTPRNSFGMRTPAEVYAEGRSKKPERKGRA